MLAIAYRRNPDPTKEWLTFPVSSVVKESPSRQRVVVSQTGATLILDMFRQVWLVGNDKYGFNYEQAVCGTEGRIFETTE